MRRPTAGMRQYLLFDPRWKADNQNLQICWLLLFTKKGVYLFETKHAVDAAHNFTEAIRGS